MQAAHIFYIDSAHSHLWNVATPVTRVHAGHELWSRSKNIDWSGLVDQIFFGFRVVIVHETFKTKCSGNLQLIISNLYGGVKLFKYFLNGVSRKIWYPNFLEGF